MKKFWSLIITFLLILIMMPVGSSPASAAISMPEDKLFVMYGAVVQNSGGGYSSLYATKQSLTKSSDSYNAGTTTGPSLTGTAHVTTNLVSVVDYPYSNQLFHTENGSTILNSTLAFFAMDYEGTITIGLQNEIEVERLNIYYIIAGTTSTPSSQSPMVMCKQGGTVSLCNHAKRIISSDASLTGSWKSVNKHNSTMSYSEGTLESAGFNKMPETAGGRKYVGFNVIENMSEANKRLAYGNGAFVVITMSVRRADTDDVYYINSALPTYMVFDSLSASSLGETSTHANVLADATKNKPADLADYNNKNNSIGKSIDRHAALIDSSPDSIDREGLDEMLEQFDTYVKPIVIIALGVLLIVRGTMLSIAIIKASDEPEVRKENIRHLITLFVSLLLIMAIIWFLHPIIDVMVDLIAGEV